MMDSGIPRDPSGTQKHDAPTHGQGRDSDDVRKLIADLMPWAATILLHGAMVLIAILIVWATLDKTEDAEVIPPPLIRTSEREGQLKFRHTKDVTNNARTDRRSPEVERRATKIESSKVKMDAIWGVAGSTAEAQSAFAPPSGGQQVGGDLFRPDRNQAGAKSFAFVIDASGSMIDTLPFVIAELKKTLRTMSPRHQFTVVFYQGETTVEALTPGLKEASQENIEATMKWLDNEAVEPVGRSSPVRGIDVALKHKPEVMFLLSDNITGHSQWEINQRELLSRIKRANVGKTKINTIQFLYPDPVSKIPGMKPTMQMISEESGGIYKFLTARELGI